MSIMYIVYSSLFKGQCRTSVELNDCLTDNSVRYVFCTVYLVCLLLLKKIKSLTKETERKRKKDIGN